MYKVKNDKCLSVISKKSMLANKKRNVILLIAIALTTIMLSTLFTVGSSVMKSIEISTTYQVGTSAHAGFKFLTKEEYDELATDNHIFNLSYNILVAESENDELYKDYTEIRYSEDVAARHGYSYPTSGKMPEKYNEIATCTTVLDDFGLSHEAGQVIHLKMSNGEHEYEGDFIVSGIWEKPASTMINQIYVSKAFQEDFAPVWKNRDDYKKAMSENLFYGSINPSFNFMTSFNISGQMAKLKARHGFGDEINDGVNWAYTTSEIDFTTVSTAAIIMLMIVLSGYLIIHNIFLIAVTSNVHYYGLLKTIGTTDKQLKKIVINQALGLSIIAIPVGLILGFVTSFFAFPLIVANIAVQDCRIIPNVWVFVACALFSWITVRVSCIKPCKFIRKISPIEAVKFTDATTGKLSKNRKSKNVSTLSMAWENLKRNKNRMVAVILSLALSVVMINVTVSIVACMDPEKFISNYAGSDFAIADAASFNPAIFQDVYDGVNFDDINAISANINSTDAGAIFMAESLQCFDGIPYERLVENYEEHTERFVYSTEDKPYYDQLVYDNKNINSHIYGVSQIVFDKMDMDTKGVDWEKFNSGKYAIVSSSIETGGDDSEYAFYQTGDKISITLPDGSSEEYEVIGNGDVSYAMGPQHGHGLDVYITIPETEYLSLFPETQGALKYFINVNDDELGFAESYFSDYCNSVNTKLDYTSRETYLKEFQETITLFLVIGGALSGIVALIGILNLVNLTYTSIHERMQELRVLNAIGMTKKQIMSMVSYEGMLRVVIAFAVVLSLGQLLNYAIVYLMAGEMIMFSYRYVVWPMLACIPVYMLIAAVIPKIVMITKRW